MHVSKTVGGLTTMCTWDPSGLGVVLADGPANEYLWGQGLVAQVTATGATYIDGDALGSTGQLTDPSGNTAGTQHYDASGQTRAQTGTQLPLQFTREQTDAESGLHYLRGRFYDPATGRFLSQDPKAAAGQDAYPYVGDDPTNGTDPSGLLRNDCWGGCGTNADVWGGTNGQPPGSNPPGSDGTSNGPLSDCASGYATEGAGGQWSCSDVNGNPVNPVAPTNPDGSCQSGYVTEVAGPDGLTTVCAYAPNGASGPPDAGT